MKESTQMKHLSNPITDSLRIALEIEEKAIRGLIDRLSQNGIDELEKVINWMYGCKGKVVVTGMGKSGHVGQKIAATLASTGTPAFFLHPAEAIHGDLGMVTRNDLVLALSNSGSTEEILRLLPSLRRLGIRLISMTGNPGSELARRSDLHIDVSVEREACPHNLAPTASTTATLAMGDAIAVCLLNQRRFSPEDFAIFHPGGNLGKKLLTTVSDIMVPRTETPIVSSSASIEEAVREIELRKFGMTCVVDQDGKLCGVFSLGDLVRFHTKNPGRSYNEVPIADYMNQNPVSIRPELLAARALNTMEEKNIRALFVTDDENRPIGLIGIYEVLKAIDY
ncbi:MAG: KpsF/GutQ family sugar-phosphate isomerase [Deltaproteobacteria bacterium]|nr:KpsF/GutQ family sugar-phosphate isomerase [Deltaproteobacteria bacterium]